MKSITIKSVDGLIGFIQDYDLKFNEYIRVLGAFNKDQRVFWSDKEDKAKLIREIEKYREHIDRQWEFPLFLGD